MRPIDSHPSSVGAPPSSTTARLAAAVALLAALALGGCRADDGGRGSPEFSTFSIEEVRTLVASRIEGLIDGERAFRAPAAGTESILATDALPAFYRSREFGPAWFERDGLSPKAEALLEWIRTSERDGLEPGHYHLAALESLLADDPVPGAGGEPDREAEIDRLAELDLLLSDAFLVLGSHLLHGRVDPDTKSAVWRANRNGTAMEDILSDALAEDTEGFRSALAALAPRNPAYDELRQALTRHLQWAREGGWTRIGSGELLQAGDHSPRVAQLRERLRVTGDAPPGDVDDAERFDSALHDAVEAFQRRHGLAPDGAVGLETLQTLNVPVEERIGQIVASLERWRWLPPELGDRYILVNIPAFETTVAVDGEEAMILRSIVGVEYRQSPVFSHEITYLVFAPRWYVPATLAAEDHLPRIREDLGFLDEQHMAVVDRESGEELDPEDIAWDEVEERDFEERYLLRQEPGPHNALGDVKFMFPNPYDVYLHDTPDPHLFDARVRDFSAGCIRVERALELAELLLEHDPEWDRERIDEVIAEGIEQEVPLERTVPVHIQYWTAWVDDSGAVQFREDLYERDDEVREALRANPPAR